ncbi:MAG: hypothetical protein OK455_04025 [Thaumarchaeota archaeon]|nr:hypothetical protein [Nitrososphaerota archaeon]
MPLTDFDKIFWLRSGLGVVGGTLSELLFGCKVQVTGTGIGTCVGNVVPDYSTGILLGLALFLGSYYVFRVTLGKKFTKEQMGKIYTTGAGSFALLFIFSWILLFTLGVTYLTL